MRISEHWILVLGLLMMAVGLVLLHRLIGPQSEPATCEVGADGGLTVPGERAGAPAGRELEMMKTIGWFSGGVSSAVAIKLIAEKVNEIIYIDIADQHPDTLRFLADCAKWYGREITILSHPVFHSVGQVCRLRRYINGPGGAACTRILKKEVRQRWEHDKTEPLCYVWGMDAQESRRVDRLRLANPEQDHIFPLVDQGIGKAEAHEILSAVGIRRPEMYNLGYGNNNCVGCVKGGQGYWNKIRVDFPEVFADRAKLEREIGASCINGVYLDELDPDAGRMDPPIADECGLFCDYQRARVEAGMEP